jgi:hypothetical protein
MAGYKAGIRPQAEPELTARHARTGSAPSCKRTLAASATADAAATLSLATSQPATRGHPDRRHEREQLAGRTSLPASSSPRSTRACCRAWPKPGSTHPGSAGRPGLVACQQPKSTPLTTAE